jgi:PAS domain S-box-containing protein
MKKSSPHKTRNLDAILNSTSDGILVVEYTSKGEIITFANQQFGKIFGFDQNTVIGKHVEEVRAIIKDRFKNQKAFLRGIRDLYRNKSKIQVDLLDIVKPIPVILERYTGPVINTQDKVIGRIWSYRDITERKQTEEEIKRERNVAQMYLDVARVIFLVIDEDQRVTLINQKGCEILGYTEEEIIGKNWFDHFLPKEIKDQVKEVFDQLMKGQVEPFEYYVNSVITKTGEERIIAWHNTTLTDKTGKTVGSLSSGEDVTKRLALERKVKLLHDAFQNSTDAIIITDLDGVIIEANQAFVNTFGFPFKEIIGKKTGFLRSRHTTNDFYTEMWNSINKTGQWTGEIINKRRDGSEVPILLSITPVYEEGKKIGYMGVDIDITERKLLEQQVIQSEKMAGLGILASGIAHEIGNPLTAISSLTQILQKKSKDSLISENLILIRSHIDRIAKIVRQMVDFAHPPSTQWELVQINQVVKEAIQLTKFDKRVKEMTIETHLNEKLPPIRIMKDQFLQVCMNILLNGIDAMEKDGILKVTTGVLNGELRIAFKDSGKGVPEELKQRIFEPFFTTKEVGKGTGLGLSVSYSIIQKHGGRIDVESRPGKGATFTVILPVR